MMPHSRQTRALPCRAKYGKKIIEESKVLNLKCERCEGCEGCERCEQCERLQAVSQISTSS